MKFGGHLVSSSLASIGVYYFFNNVLSALIFWLSSIAIDADHLFEYARACGIKKFSFRSFCQWCYDFRVGKLWLFFHSFELLFLLWGIIFLLKLNLYWVSFACGITFHMILDCLFNPIFAWSYFFIFRWRKNFCVEKIFRKEIVEKIRCRP